MSLQKGDKAPLFHLYSSEKKQINLEDYAGKNVVILFFPLAFTSTCTAELCSVRDDISQYSSLNAEVIAISVDSPHTLAIYKREQNLNFTLLSDFNKEASRAYDSIYEMFGYNMKGVSKRSAFVVDKNGIIQYAEVLESAGDLPNFEAINATLEQLK